MDRPPRDLTINKEQVILLLDFWMTEEQEQVLADLEEINRCDKTTNNPHRGMSKVKYSSNEMSHKTVYATLTSYVRRVYGCLLYTSPSPRDRQKSRMPSSA